MKRKIIAVLCCLLCLASLLYAEEDELDPVAKGLYDDAVQKTQAAAEALQTANSLFDLIEPAKTAEQNKQGEINGLESEQRSISQGGSGALTPAQQKRMGEIAQALETARTDLEKLTKAREKAEKAFEDASDAAGRAAQAAEDAVKAYKNYVAPPKPTDPANIPPNSNYPVEPQNTPFVPTALGDVGDNQTGTDEIDDKLKALLDGLDNLQNGLDDLAKKAESYDAALALNDPILSTSGRYLFTETDFSVTVYGTTFYFGRYYNSGKNISDNMGRDWYFTVDTRVIKGKNWDYKDTYKETKQNYNNALNNYKESKKLREEVVNKYTAEIKRCKGEKSRLEIQLAECTNSQFKDDFEEVIGTINSLIDAYGKRIASLEKQKEIDLNTIDTSIDNQGKLVDKLRETWKSVQIQYLVSTKNDKLNELAYRGTGFGGATSDGSHAPNECGYDRILIYDENGTCYSYRLTASPTLTPSGDEEHPTFEEADNYYPNGSDTENLIPGDYSRVRLNPDGTVTWHRKDNQIWTYGSDGFIRRMENLQGNGIDFEYKDKRIDRICHKGTTLYTFTYDAQDRLMQIQNVLDPMEPIHYEYGNDGRLSQTIDADGDAVKFYYGQLDKRLAEIEKPDGNSVQIKYEAQVGEEKWANMTIDENGNSQRLEYDKDKGITYAYDANQIPTIYTWDKNTQKTTHILYPDGTERSYTYNDAGDVISETYKGITTSYGYDARGNKTAAIYSDGSTETWIYNSYDQLLTYKDRDGVKVEYKYDENNNVTNIYRGGKLYFQGRYTDGLLKWSMDGLGTITNYEYDEFGNVTKRTTGTISETFQYDGRGRVTSITDGENRTTSYKYEQRKVTEKTHEGLETTYEYNTRKDLIKVTVKDTKTGEERITEYKYDAAHHVTEITNPDIKDADGKPVILVKYEYDAVGNVISMTYGDGEESWTSSYGYDNMGRITGTTATKEGLESVYGITYGYYTAANGEETRTIETPSGSMTSYIYDPWGRVKKTVNAAGETNQRILTEAGRVKNEQSAHGGWYEYELDGNTGDVKGAGEKGKSKTTAEYYDNGSVKSTTDRLGNTTSYEYNSSGLLKRTTSEERSVWYTYDKAGRITGQYVTEPDVTTPVIASSYSYYYQQSGNVDTYTEYAYSKDGRTVTVTSGGIISSTMKLNAFGEVTETSDGEGNTVRYEYDALGRNIRVTDGYGKSEEYEYNALGKVSRVTLRDGTTESYEYDHTGSVTRITDEDGVRAEYGYDADGRLITAKVRGKPLTEYEYDALGRVTRIRQAGEITEEYAYTARGRLVTSKDAKGLSYTYEYDGFGRLMTETDRLEQTQTYGYDAEGTVSGKTDFNGKTTQYTYDAKTRTRTTEYADGTKTTTVYTPSGLIKSADGETGRISYEYNAAGLLVKQTDEGAGEETTYTYDRAGRRTKTETSTRTITYTYGKNGETKSVKDVTNGTSVSFTYDGMGRETKRTFASGVTQSTAYDRLGRTTAIITKSRYGSILSAECYVYDNEGRRSMTVNQDGKTTFYEYDKNGRLAKVTYPYSDGLDASARREALEAGLGTVFARAEWKQLSFDELSKLTEVLDRTGTGLYRNILSTEPVWIESYKYDKNGNMTEKTTPYGTICYTYDDENRLRFSGKDRLVTTEAEIGGRTTNLDTATGGEWYAADDGTEYTAAGLRGTRYTYDANGNMLSSENLYSVKFFDYNANNRMKLSTVTDLSTRSYTATAYAYDAFGRRTLTQTEGETATRTLYDGQSFDMLRQGTADGNGKFVSISATQNSSSYGYGYGYSIFDMLFGYGYGSRNGYGINDMMYDMFFGGLWGFGRGGHGAKEGEETEPEYYDIDNLYPLYANGNVVASYEEESVYSPYNSWWNAWGGFYGGNYGQRQSNYATYSDTYYYGTDVLGSVRLSSGADGHVSGTVDYDVFGKPVMETGVFAGSAGGSGGISALVFAYAGKPYDPVTGLSDYGFRDYAPTLARFTTVDPIRDGSNWYAYCNSDPVNYVDMWGLEDIIIFSAIDVYESFDNALYDLFVHDSYDEIKKAAKEQGLTYRVISGKNATKKAFDDAYTNSQTKRLIVIAHGNEDGELFSADNAVLNKDLDNPGQNLEIIDAVGCYASRYTSKNDWKGGNNNIDVRTYNPGCTTPKTDDDDEIMYYQTNEVIDLIIPESILNGGKNNTREPTEYPTWRKFLDWARASGSHENTHTSSQAGEQCETNNN